MSQIFLPFFQIATHETNQFQPISTKTILNQLKSTKPFYQTNHSLPSWGSFAILAMFEECIFGFETFIVRLVTVDKECIFPQQ